MLVVLVDDALGGVLGHVSKVFRCLDSVGEGF